MKINNKTLKLPVIQGGMGVGVSLSRLSGAVAKCGGVGVISTADVGFKEPDYWKNATNANTKALKQEIQKAREICGDEGILAINAMVATTDYKACVETAVQNGIDAIISGAGLPLELPQLCKDSSVALAPIVSSGRAAQTICKLWLKRHNRLPDFIVVEGPLAGGHLGFDQQTLLGENIPTLESLVTEVIEKTAEYKTPNGENIPVFAAGGVFTAQDVKQQIDNGAYGVQVATRFIATEECDASAEYKNAFLSIKEQDIKIVKSPAGLPGRAVNNKHIEKITQANIQPTRCVNCLVPCKKADAPYCITEALIKAVLGDTENGLVFCGQNAHRIKEITTVQSLMSELTALINV